MLRRQTTIDDHFRTQGRFGHRKAVAEGSNCRAVSNRDVRAPFGEERACLKGGRIAHGHVLERCQRGPKAPALRNQKPVALREAAVLRTVSRVPESATNA